MSKRDEHEYIFVKYFTTKSGKRVYASQHGLKAFKLKVKKGKRGE